jgi:hypothetical protein
MNNILMYIFCYFINYFSKILRARHALPLRKQEKCRGWIKKTTPAPPRGEL